MIEWSLELGDACSELRMTGPMRVVVHVSPRARTTYVGGRYGDTDPPVLMLRVTAPAAGGKANSATVSPLADVLDLARGDIRIISGHHSRNKIIEISGAGPDVVAALLVR